MSEIIELSDNSNSSDTVILPLINANYMEDAPKQDNKNKECSNSFDDAFKAFDDIDNILKKYTSSSSNNISQSSQSTRYTLDDFSDSSDIELYAEKPKHNLDKRVTKISKKSTQDSLENRSSDTEEISTYVGPSKAKKSKTSKEMKELLRLEKESQKQQKLKDKQEKQLQKERDKELKRAVLAANKNLKPDECLKFITTHIDFGIMNEDFSKEIEKNLNNFGIKYKLQSQIIPFTITWNRQAQSTLLNDNGNLVLSSEDTETDEIILILNCKSFIEHVSNNSLLTYVQSVKSVYSNKKLTLGIYSLEDYFKYRKLQFKDLPIVHRNKIEFALTEIQILCSCSYRSLENPEDVGMFIAQFSKSIAQLPYKLEKQEKNSQTEWYMSGDNKDCVKIDKDGNGLNRLWHQQLTTFPLARLETAEAIAAEYKTPSHLFEAYNSCSTTEEGELLLQNIPIRRAAGPLTTVRRIGPELSKKVYKFYTSLEGDIIL